MTQVMTVGLLKEALPKNLQTNATQEFADLINQMAVEPETLDEIRGNFLTYTKVLVEGKYKTEDYFNAVAYVTHKLMGYTNREAYVRTFPDRYNILVLKGTSDKDISAYVSAYHRNKLVNAILEQSIIPTHVLYQDAFHAAIKTQVELMANAASEKVRSDAANSVLTHVKPPEIKKIELDIGLKDNSGMAELKASMRHLAETQQQMIVDKSFTPGQVAGAPLALTQQEKAEAIDVTPEPAKQAVVPPAEEKVFCPEVPARRVSLFDVVPTP